MKQKHNIFICSAIWIVAIVILMVSLSQNVGIAKIINYSGIVRGATQKLIKKEIYGNPDDQLIVHLDGILENLQTGNGKYELIKLSDDLFQDQLEEMSQVWQNIKIEIKNVRQGESKENLYLLSEDYFEKADQMVLTAQSISDSNTILLVRIFFVYLIITMSIFVFWYKYKQRQIKKAMYIDELTGINNFSGFEIELKEKMDKLSGNMAMLCLDIDGFKYLNSLYGIQTGDQLLRVVAWTLQSFVGEKGCVARYGSDEFLILCEFDDLTISSLKQLIIENVKSSIELDIYRDLTLCIGVYMTQKERIYTMIDNATLAHKQAKQKGKGCALCYDQELLDKLYYESRLAKNFYTALNDDQFKLYLQPKFEIPSLKVVGAEALVRWQDKDDLLLPDTFIPSLEQNGYIYDLDFFMLEKACKFIKEHQLETTDFRISVNFSRVTIHHQDFSKRLDDVMKTYHIPIHCIELEITETAFNDFSTHIIEMLNKLSQQGYIFSMDDFGAGYSSLNSIHTIPVDIIKIDKAFLKESRLNKSVVSIMQLIVETAHLLNKTIICEGVEEKEDIKLLNKMGCFLGQGYYVSRPIKQNEFVLKFLSKK